MTLPLILKLVKRNFIALKTLFIPFILSASIMLGLEYIIISIIYNDYILERHPDLPLFLKTINVILMILTSIFIIYSNSFIMKRRRQEYALQMVLGLEKRHLHLISLFELSVQMILTSILSIVGGYLFGNLLFVMLNKLISKTQISIMQYPFSMKAAGITLLLCGGLFLILFMINLIHTSTRSPIKLMNESYAGEKKTRNRILIPMCLLGIIALSFGYYLALTTETIASSFQRIFNAILCVLIGTYCLFMSLSILLLQGLKRMPKIYYKPKNFFSISGLLSRIKTNVVGLASITMLCTFLIVTMGMTLTTYRGLEEQVNKQVKEDYDVYFDGNHNYNQETKQRVASFQKEVASIAPVDRFRVTATQMIAFKYQDGAFKKSPHEMGMYTSQLVYGVFVTEKDHNKAKNQHIHLKDDEIVIASSSPKFKNLDKVKVAGKTYKVITSDKDEIGNQIAGDSLYVIVKDDATYKDISNYYASNQEQQQSKQDLGNTSISFNLQSDKEAFEKAIPKLEKKYGVHVTVKDEVRKSLYELNGGLIFLGMVVSIVLLVGTFLMLYYKQIMWVFVLPIIVALIHTLFAGKIIYYLLGILGVRDISLFLTSYIAVIFAVVITYGLMYWVTSTIYYKIVQTK
ncbi:FtsX-like permease family protein [Staphylococcus sp. 11511212]|uniref:FtsX-like permease family protein n=1 Tax=Staphylococcus sp. 11511212 TaxID=2714544 RepID=UPI001403B130|nr:FtsX-like permease family protein [Staphylococcus sp. 11511212]NHM77673.1 ABC transporter permease [Staphylococcus sp. 11511212]